MKNLGLAVVMLAFLAGAFLSVLDPSVVMWRWMVPVLLAGAVGLWLHRKARHAETRSGHRLSGNMDTLQSLSLIHISEPTRQLASSRMPSSA